MGSFASAPPKGLFQELDDDEDDDDWNSHNILVIRVYFVSIVVTPRNKAILLGGGVRTYVERLLVSKEDFFF